MKNTKNTKTVFAAGLAALVLSAGARPKPSPMLQERIKAGIEVYGLVHWGLNTFTCHEVGSGCDDPKWLNPDAFDADQIVGACKDGGLQGLVIVAKHHDGFCLWPTKTTDYNITKSPIGCSSCLLLLVATATGADWICKMTQRST